MIRGFSMFITAAATIILSFVLVLSLHFVKQRFDGLELTILFIFSSYICQNTYYKLFSPYDRLSVGDSGWAKLTVIVHFGIVLPILLIIVLFILKSTNPSFYAVSSIAWIFIIIVYEKIFLISGILEKSNEHWYPTIDAAAAVVILFITTFVMKKIHRILKKEQVIT
jgi:hypothetical protein